MNKLLCALMLAATASVIHPAFAQSGAADAKAKAKPAVKKTAKKTVKKAVRKTQAQEEAAAATANVIPASDDDEEGGQPLSLEGSVVTEYDCELGDKVTIYSNAGDDKHVAIRWKHALHRMRRIATTTGANRFENRKYGLVWINIPTKAMLLDSKRGLQLANECRNPEQAKLFAQKH